jgi:hypothetical protein
MINKFNNAGDLADVGTITSTPRVATLFYYCDTDGTPTLRVQIYSASNTL